MSDEKQRPKVFISHSHQDAQFAQKLYERLSKLNLSPWMDKQDVEFGVDWQKKIQSAIGQASLVLTTNFDSLLDEAFREADVLNLPEQIEHATELQLPKTPDISVVESIATINDLSVGLITHLKDHTADIHKLKWDVFEHLVAEFLAAQGLKDVRLVGRDPMTSADIFAIHTIAATGDDIRLFVEVKRTKAEVGINVINEVLGAFTMERPKYGWDVAMIVSLAGFKDLRKIANEDVSLFGVRLKDRSHIERWLEGYTPNGSGLWLPDRQFKTVG